MIPAKRGPISMTKSKEKSVESIVDWFDQHKQSFYILGWSYLKSQEQMEELFYRSIIKVHKELPRYKRELSFDTWVTSIFMHICQEISDDRSLQVSEKVETRHDLFNALDQLKKVEKEAVVLTYITGISQEDTAKLLQVSVEQVKEYLFSGLQSLRKGMGDGSRFNGCNEYQQNYIDYIERTLDREKKVEFEVHMYHCQDCQEDFADFKEIMLTLLNFTESMKDFHVPSDFMENVTARLTEEDKQRRLKSKKRKRLGIVFASVFALLIGIEVFTGSFTSLYYTWAEEDPELRDLLQQGLVKRLDLEAESNGVKIKIRSAIADDVQTLVFYEIEDTAENNQYAIVYNDGASVENDYDIMNRETGHMYYYFPDLKSDQNNKEKNVFQGKLSLLALTKDSGTIKLKITQLLKLVRDPSDPNSFGAYENMEYKTGEWNFEIPVTKWPSKEYALDESTEIEGIPVRFNKLTIAPTATILKYAVNNEHPEKRVEFLTADNLEVNNKKVKATIYDSSFTDFDMNGSTFQTKFPSLYGEKPKEIKVQFGFARITVEHQKAIELDPSSKYPETFEYAGSTISIDKVEIGESTNIVISNHDIENRAFESLNYDIVSEAEKEYSSMEMNSEGVLVDKNGIKYDENEIPFAYEEIEQPRYFYTVQETQLKSNYAGETVIPKKLMINGYNTTKYLDDVVKISLKK